MNYRVLIPLEPGDRKRHEIDELVGPAALEGCDVEALLAAGVIEPLDDADESQPGPAGDSARSKEAATEKGPLRMKEVVETIDCMDLLDQSLWMKSGAPKLAALREAAGDDQITAARRDEAWDILQAGG